MIPPVASCHAFCSCIFMTIIEAQTRLAHEHCLCEVDVGGNVSVGGIGDCVQLSTAHIWNTISMIYCSLQNVFAIVFCQWKINYDDQNVEIWRRNVQCHELTFFACNAWCYESRADVSAPLSENVTKMLLELTFKCLSVSNDTQNGS